jgi:hypothetical protein
VIPIHPKGVVNKLIVEKPQAPRVLRYDLRDQVKPMTGVFASPGGIDTLEIGKGKVGVPIDTSYFDLTIDKVEEFTAPEAGFKPEDGKKLVIATFTAKNVSKYKPSVQGITFDPKLKDEDGDSVNPEVVAKMSSADPIPFRMLEPDEQMKFRVVFQFPAKAKPVSIRLNDGHSNRAVQVDLK